jgi:glycosyltransferase involved in cell wall biosynthesis
VSGASREAPEARAEAPDRTSAPAGPAPEPVPVEFLGWLPAFKRFGDCGTHPQFAHTDSPPPGYRFVHSAPDQLSAPPTRIARFTQLLGAVLLSLWSFAATACRHGPLRTLGTLFLFLRFVVALVRKTGRVLPSVRFAHSRHFESQVLTPGRAELVFLTSVPYTYGQRPWVIEIEDPTTLFHPFILNGQTAELDVRRSPYFAAVKALLEADNCRGIVTHIRSTAELLPTLFASEVIARKVTYAPLGVELPPEWQQHDSDGPINLLFTNSWHQMPDSFFLRGGLDVLEAFDVLRRRYPQVRLTIRSALPLLPDRYHRILCDGWVRIIERFLPAAQMTELQRDGHVFLLPAARVHIVSVLRAMAFGQAVVVSDGWGMDEYVDHGQTGLIVPGRRGRVTWADHGAGVLREDYRPMYEPDPNVVQGLIESVSLLVEQRTVRQRLGRAARSAVETRFTLDRWNAGLKSAFDLARAN